MSKNQKRQKLIEFLATLTEDEVTVVRNAISMTCETAMRLGSEHAGFDGEYTNEEAMEERIKEEDAAIHSIWELMNEI